MSGGFVQEIHTSLAPLKLESHVACKQTEILSHVLMEIRPIFTFCEADVVEVDQSRSGGSEIQQCKWLSNTIVRA